MSEEARPKIDSFLFNLKHAPEAEKEIDMRMSEIDAKIDKLVRGVEINGINILGHLLGLTHNPEELTKLGKALQMVAPLIAKHDDLKMRKSVFELATKEPGWLAGVFGDFSAEVDQFTSDELPED